MYLFGNKRNGRLITVVTYPIQNGMPFSNNGRYLLNLHTAVFYTAKIVTKGAFFVELFIQSLDKNPFVIK